MKIDVLTLFPSMFDGFINESIIKRARDKKIVEINIHNFRAILLIRISELMIILMVEELEWFLCVSLFLDQLMI